MREDERSQIMFEARPLNYRDKAIHRTEHRWYLSAKILVGSIVTNGIIGMLVLSSQVKVSWIFLKASGVRGPSLVPAVICMLQSMMTFLPIPYQDLLSCYIKNLALLSNIWLPNHGHIMGASHDSHWLRKFNMLKGREVGLMHSVRTTMCI